jgi:Flp pilus assembly protein TadG
MRGRAVISSALRFVADQTGSTATEFVLVLTPLILLTLGAINLALMVYTVSTLHFAVQDAARCASVRPTVCNSATIQDYGAGNYGGMTAPPAFVLTKELASSATCPDGNLVTATANYNFTTGMTSMIVPLSASACYPAA